MELWIPLLAGLAGALIGALASIGTVIVQSWDQQKRHRQDLAVRIALEDFKLQNGLAKPGDLQMPVSVYVAFYVDLLDAVHSGKLDSKKLSEINNRSSQLAKGFASVRVAE